jgi:hypothetical protein
VSEITTTTGTESAAQPASMKPADNARLLLQATDGLHIELGSNCGENENDLLVAAIRLTDVEKTLKLVTWLRAGDIANLTFLALFGRFWHEAIVAGLDTEALLDFALNWHLAASARGYTKSAASRYWLTVRALEEIGLLDTPVAKPHRRKGKQK